MPPTELDFVKKFVDNILGFSTPLNQLDSNLIKCCFEALSRQEEIDISIRDQWDNWDWQYSDAQRRGQLYIPWLDNLVDEWRNSAGISSDAESHWPDNKPFALCLTHDVDDVQKQQNLYALFNSFRLALRNRKSPSKIFTRFLDTLDNLRRPKSAPGSTRSRRYYEDWLKLEDQYGFKSTMFFFPAHLGMPHPYDCIYQFQDVIWYSNKKMTVADMMKEMHKAGWEIGLHGSYHSATKLDLLMAEKQQVEEAINHSIMSTRQHFLHYEVDLTPQLQEQAGFLTDSTQGFNRSIGFRAGTSFPYRCWNHHTKNAMAILEIPQHIMDGALFTLNALEYNEELAIQHSLQLMDKVEQVGGCLTLSWHPQFLNDDKYWNVYAALLAEGHHRGAWGCSAGQLYNWWTAREARIAKGNEQLQRIVGE